MFGLFTLMEELAPQVNFSWVGCCRSRGRCTELFSNSGYSCGRGTERP